MSSLLVPECYSYIIGLSRTQCECYTIPEDASTSLSGLYLDELESLSAISSALTCESGTEVFEQMERARQIAVTTFQADVNALLMKGFKLKRNNYSGVIGRAVWNKVTSQTLGQYYGVRWRCNNIKSGVAVIKNIGAMFTQTDTILLHIYNNLGEEVVPAFFLQTLANKHQKNTVDIELPLHSPYIENLEYYFIYQSGANIALNNDIKCNCGGFKPYFDVNKPYFYHVQNDRNYMWSNWLMVGGYHTDTIPDYSKYPLPMVTSNMMYGLTFEVDLKCKVNEVLCYESLDFESNNLAGAMALAIQHKAASVLASWIINTANLNRLNIVGTEQLLADISKWNDIYNTMTNFIAEQADITVNDCLVCRDVFEMGKVGIFA